MKIGQKVRLRKIIDKGIAVDFATKVGEVGVIKKEKIVDGGQFAYIVSFGDEKSTWFFPDELEFIG